MSLTTKNAEQKKSSHYDNKLQWEVFENISTSILFHEHSENY